MSSGKITLWKKHSQSNLSGLQILLFPLVWWVCLFAIWHISNIEKRVQYIFWHRKSHICILPVVSTAKPSTRCLLTTTSSQSGGSWRPWRLPDPCLEPSSTTARSWWQAEWTRKVSPLHAKPTTLGQTSTILFELVPPFYLFTWGNAVISHKYPQNPSIFQWLNNINHRSSTDSEAGV